MPHRMGCPLCSAKVERISYAVNFMMVDGVRYRTSATWDIHHDQSDGSEKVCQLFDGKQTVGEETQSGVVWEWDRRGRLGQLRDLQTGEVVLRWQEPELERAAS